jgi:hypothetical protein
LWVSAAKTARLFIEVGPSTIADLQSQSVAGKNVTRESGAPD